MGQSVSKPQFGDFNPAQADSTAKKEQQKIEKEPSTLRA